MKSVFIRVQHRLFFLRLQMLWARLRLAQLGLRVRCGIAVIHLRFGLQLGLLHLRYFCKSVFIRARWLRLLFLGVLGVLCGASVFAQTTVTGTFKLPSGQTCTAAAIRTETVGGTAICGRVRFTPYDAAGRRVVVLTFGGVTYLNYEVVAYVRASDNALLAHDPVADTVSVGMPLIPNINATPAGTVTRAGFAFNESSNGAIAAPPIVYQQKIIPDQASVDWGSIAPAALAQTSVSPQLQSNGEILNKEIFSAAADPGNAPASKAHWWFDSTAGVMKCKTSTGADCNPAGAGSGDITRVGDCLTGDCYAAVLANLIYGGPASGAAAQATMRLQVAADVPNLDAAKITTGSFPDARVDDTITAANYLPLAGGTLTGTLVARAGAAGAGTAPLKFQAGALNTAPEAHALEWDGSDLFVTQATGPTRRQLAFITGNVATATALAANGANCGVGLLPRGVDAAGVAEGCAAVNMASEVSGTLPIGNGGTGQTTQTAGFNALDPLTTLGDLLYHDGTNSLRLAGNIAATKKFLTQTGTGTVSATPAWGDVDFANLTGSLAIGQVPNDLVTYAKIQNVSATSRFLGRITAGAGDIEELTPANAATLLAEQLALADLSDVGSKRGNSTQVQMTTGAAATDDCAKFDLNGNLVSAGAACGTSTGAPVGAQYVVMALDATLSAERRLQGTANEITLTDGGANGDVTLAIHAALARDAETYQSFTRAEGCTAKVSASPGETFWDVINLGTAGIDRGYWVLDDDATNDAFLTCWGQMPVDVAGTPAAKITFEVAPQVACGASQNFRVNVKYLFYASGGQPNAAHTTETAQDIAGATTAFDQTAALFPSTGSLASAPAASNFWVAEITRDSNHANDTCAQKMLLLPESVRILYDRVVKP